MRISSADLGTDLLAHRMYIVDSAGEAIGPNDTAIRGLNELDEDEEI